MSLLIAQRTAVHGPVPLLPLLLALILRQDDDWGDPPQAWGGLVEAWGGQQEPWGGETQPWGTDEGEESRH
jgi:hypothetical protein